MSKYGLTREEFDAIRLANTNGEIMPEYCSRRFPFCEAEVYLADGITVERQLIGVFSESTKRIKTINGNYWTQDYVNVLGLLMLGLVAVRDFW